MGLSTERITEKNNIGYGQLLILLLMCRVFTVMTYVPLIGKGYTLSTQLIAIVLSVVIQAILVIPVIYLNKANPSMSVTSSAYGINKYLGVAYSILYFVYFVVYASNSVLRFQRFIIIRFYPEANRYLWLAVFVIVCVYCAYLGIEGIARSSVFVFLIFIAMVVLMLLMSCRDIDISNYYFDVNYSNSIYSAVIEDLSRNGEIVALAFLMKYVKKGLRCSAYGYIASKLIMLEFVTFLIITVLGDFASLTDYPFMEVGSYAGVRLIQRLDAIYMVVWTITAVINIALFIFVCGDIIKEHTHRMKLCYSLCGLVVFLLCMPLITNSDKQASIFAFQNSGYAVVIYTGVLPAVLLLIRKVREYISQDKPLQTEVERGE